MARRVNIIPHTHWDREWYLPYQSFRLKLVDLLDGLLPQLETDPAYAHFLLDGQMAVVEDYLAVRPEAEDRLRALAATGRLAMGPWYTLPDEFLVSGETLVRNLARGLAVAAEFGGAMEVGYLPDMFGHAAQMPQILRLFGFEHTVVWRGVPSAINRTGFWWSAPDGSTVRAEYLPLGYGNGALVPNDASALLRRIGEFEEEQGDLLTGPILWMNGTDHLMPQSWLGRVVAEANALDAGYELRIGSLVDHVTTAPTEGLPTWTGELRSGARANLLMGVGSNRVDVKQAAARAERALERQAEPLSALFLPAADWPGALLDEAWLEVIRNSAHDSICACSADAVGAAVLHRFAEASQIADGLTDRALHSLGATIGVDGTVPVIVNSSSRTRHGVVEMRFPGTEVPEGCQLVSARPAERVLMEGITTEVATIMVSELEYARNITAFSIDASDGTELIRVEREPAGTLVTPPVRRALTDLRQNHAGEGVRVRVSNRAAVTVLGQVANVAGFGWQAWTGASVTTNPVSADELHLTNGAITIEIDPTEGTFAIDGVKGFGQLVDGGDDGDTYNWSPPRMETVVDTARSVTTNVLEAGPVRARVEILRTYVLPTHIEDEARVGAHPVEVRTTLELHAGDDVVRVHIEFDNHGVRDHRLRVHLPLPQRAEGSLAECAFATVERGLCAEGGVTEQGIPTYPSRRFVSAGGLTVAHEGLLEYELIDLDATATTAGALALTLLRCTGMLSQGPMTTRALPAGPLTPLEAPQSQHRVEARFALHVGGRNPYAVVDDAFLPLLVTRGGGHVDSAATQGQALLITGVEVSAVTREAGALHVRVFNPSAQTTTVGLDGRHGSLVDLRGRRVEAFANHFTLGPWQIATAAISED